ncbi:C2H2-type zinc finger protein [Candidatus Babeliales bacterium]|nr:C2H2-type zinc finger protein [Candidatus Babeliales bacterium]
MLNKSILLIITLSLFTQLFSVSKETNYQTIPSNIYISEEEIENLNPIFMLACLGNTKMLKTIYKIDGEKQILITHPITKRNILHYIALFNQHKTLKKLLKYDEIKKAISDKDIFGVTPFEYALSNGSDKSIDIFSEYFLNHNQFYNALIEEKNIYNNHPFDNFYDKTDFPEKDNNFYDNHLYQKYYQSPTDTNLHHLSVEPLMKEKNLLIQTHKKKEPSLNKTTNKSHKYYNQKTGRYYCDMCDKSYTTSYRLFEHKERIHEIIRTKTTNKSHKCYNRKTGKYYCDMCDKSYTTFYRLFEHKERIHGIIRTKTTSKYKPYFNTKTLRYECPKCENNYTMANTLGLHLKSIHGIILKNLK